MSDYRKLKVWAASHALAVETNRLTGGFPETEREGLAEELNRAAVLVPCFLAEGCGSRAVSHFARAIGQARGALAELDQLLLLARDLSFFDDRRCEELCGRAAGAGRMLRALAARLPRSGGRGETGDGRRD